MAEEVAQKLGIEVLPTIQFYRDGKLLWEHKGLNNLEQVCVCVCWVGGVVRWAGAHARAWCLGRAGAPTGRMPPRGRACWLLHAASHSGVAAS